MTWDRFNFLLIGFGLGLIASLLYVGDLKASPTPPVACSGVPAFDGSIACN